MCCQNKSKGNDKMELNIDQLRIVNSKPNGHTLIKGVAGSGKTTVAVSKIPNLINHYMGKDDEILFVTYNKTLIEYTRYLLKDMNIQQNIFFEFNIDKQLNIRTIDSIIYEYGKKIKPFFIYCRNKSGNIAVFRGTNVCRKAAFVCGNDESKAGIVFNKCRQGVCFYSGNGYEAIQKCRDGVFAIIQSGYFKV